MNPQVLQTDSLWTCATQNSEASCLLNPFPTSGKEKSLCILEPRIEGSQKWRLDAVLEITSCVFSFPLEPWVDFSIQLHQWGNVLLFLEFLDSFPSMWLCLNAFWGNASSPLNTEGSLWWILRTRGHPFRSLFPPQYIPPPTLHTQRLSIQMITDGEGHFSPLCSWKESSREVPAVAIGVH